MASGNDWEILFKTTLQLRPKRMCQAHSVRGPSVLQMEELHTQRLEQKASTDFGCECEITEIQSLQTQHLEQSLLCPFFDIALLQSQAPGPDIFLSQYFIPVLIRADPSLHTKISKSHSLLLYQKTTHSQGKGHGTACFHMALFSPSLSTVPESLIHIAY